MGSIPWINIKLVISDFDGVFTDNKVYLCENGLESVVCSRSDGFGIELLKKNGIELQWSQIDTI